MPNRIGQQLGNYRLTRLLGDGGFAEVYLGEHVHIGTQAAIKVLHTQLTNNDVESFRQEASTIARLIHPHIVRVLEFGIEGKIPFLVMDYAPNSTLRDRRSRGTPLPIDVVVAYAKQMADALQYAHDARLIHRDIKPENMLVGRRNEILLSDFGIAVVAHSTRSQKTEDVIGTVDYMAPEQINAHPSIASDQYALACVVYEWLTGMPPFQGTSTEVVVKHLQIPPAPLRAKVPTILPFVEEIVLKALEKDPQRRFAEVQAFATALEQAYLSYSAPNRAVQSPMPVQPIPGVVPPPGLSGRAPTPPNPIQPQRVGTLRGSYKGHTTLVTRVKWSPDGKWIASVSHDKTVQVWEASTGGKIVSYTGHTALVTGAVWSPDGKWIASASDDGTVQLWDATTGYTDFTYGGHFTAVKALIGSPDGKLIASVDADRQIHVWDVATGYAVFTSSTQESPRGPQVQQSPYRVLPSAQALPSNPLITLAWSFDGKWIVSASGDQTVGILDVVTRKQIFSYNGHQEKISAVACSPDGKWIASASSDKTVQVWQGVTNLPQKNAVNRSSLEKCHFCGADTRPNDNFCLNCGDRITDISGNRIVNTVSSTEGTNTFTYVGHRQAVNTVAWSPNSKRIASGSDDSTVQVWDATTGSYVFTYRGHAEPVKALAWSPDGKYIASAGQSGTIQVWVAA